MKSSEHIRFEYRAAEKINLFKQLNLFILFIYVCFYSTYYEMDRAKGMHRTTKYNYCTNKTDNEF